MSSVSQSLLFLLLIDVLFLVAILGLVFVVTRGKPAGMAVLRRNFVGYFSNPTGYLFILLFVSLCSAGAFFPHDFFADNLATLHQLNKWFPWIMLFYIPTITMGIWSEERRQGTDELLLTVPASDWDIVLGKYVAAASIFTASLLFSQVANFLVLAFLSMGEVDLGLFLATYLGYWLVGLAMIALGMVGSFVTRNLTIGFILGVLFNLPLVVSSYASTVISGDAYRLVSRFSYAEQFFDLGRGVVSLRSVVFFALVVATGLYLSMVLVGRRHWYGGRDGQSLFGHYFVRVICLMATAIALTFVFVHHDPARIDATSQQVNSLSGSTIQLMKNLDQQFGEDSNRAVLIEAFISAQVPEEYVKTKVDLISKLREFEAKGGNRVQVRIYDNLERASDQAVKAEEQYGIEPQTVLVRERGVLRQEDIFMGAAFISGLERVVVPFFDLGIPVEYELIRSICTVASDQRKRLGIVTTDAQLFGGFDMQRMSQVPKQQIVTELEKQYEVVQIDPASPIEEEVDVMMVVQPSSLNQPQMDNLVAAIRTGIPTAIFEDPMPYFRDAPGTGEPKRPRGGGMMGMGGQPEPKADIQTLWNALGVSMVGQPSMGMGPAGGGFDAAIAWQAYMPYKKLSGFRQITPEWVFASTEAPGGEESLNPDDEIVSGLREILFIMPGAVTASDRADLEVTPIVTTGEDSGTVPVQQLRTATDPNMISFVRRQGREPHLNIAVRIRSKNLTSKSSATATSGDVSHSGPSSVTDTLVVAGQAATGDDAATQPETGPDSATDMELPPALGGNMADSKTTSAADKINVVFVSDIDVMNSTFLNVRAQPNMSDVNWQFDNVTFVLNVIDDLAGDERFLDVRKKRTRHSSLKLVEQQAADARAEAEQQIERFKQEFEAAEADAREQQNKAVAELQEKVNELQEKARESGGGAASGREIQRALQAALQQMAAKQEVEQRRFDTTVERLKRERDRKLAEIERKLEKQEQSIRNTYKWMALLLPMLPPLMIGLAVFVRRRSLESEGITPDRRR